MILIVDDKQENLFSLKALLQLNDYKVDTANSGENALKRILKNDYALIILDVQMPGMDGFEVAESIRGYSKSKDIPILFLSAVNTDKRFITKGYSAGAVDYVTKPFDSDLLLLKVKTFYRLYEQSRELSKMQTELKQEIQTRKLAQQELEEINLLLEAKVEARTTDLVETNVKLESRNSELQQYAFLASHDLQEPLRKILTYIRLIEDRYISDIPESKKYFEKVINSAERMRILIDDLLNYSQLSNESSFILTDLNSIVDETINDLEIAIKDKSAKIQIDNLPNVEIIPAQMRQVFQNLLSNSLKFSKEKEQCKILISSRYIKSKAFFEETVDSGDFVEIEFEDNGIGFNEIYLEKIFTIFQRLHGKEEFAGTGIGLAIVKKIVEKHHGLITATSNEGVGTKFKIVLPILHHVQDKSLP